MQNGYRYSTIVARISSCQYQSGGVCRPVKKLELSVLDSSIGVIL